MIKMTKKDLRLEIRKIIREVLADDIKDDSATIKYKTPKDVDSSTIDIPKKHSVSSTTIKERRGYSHKELLDLLKKSKSGSIEVRVNGRNLGIDNINMLDDMASGFGLTQGGREIEFNYSDVEFIEVDGRRV